VFDTEKFADEVEGEVLRTRKDLTIIVRVAANHIVKLIVDKGELEGVGHLLTLAHAFAYIEGAQRGVLPGTPPLLEDS
jgi:hypothetical protein